MEENKGCHCGCNADDMEHEGCSCAGHDEEEETIITLTLMDGEEMDCIVLTIFPAGEKEYIALLPEEQAETGDGEVFLYRYAETPQGEPDLQNIEDDDEYMIVAQTFDALLDEAETHGN